MSRDSIALFEMCIYKYMFIVQCALIVYVVVAVDVFFIKWYHVQRSSKNYILILYSC